MIMTSKGNVMHPVPGQNTVDGLTDDGQLGRCHQDDRRHQRQKYPEARRQSGTNLQLVEKIQRVLLAIEKNRSFGVCGPDASSLT